ncbi:MAG TPA: DUF6390 family protein [Candidatus Bathyarchaeia archaeon]|nr:DUF6390 family protein [Candidatus Bathyarchaeia archaeon]
MAVSRKSGQAISGAVFSARHSYMPNSLGYCGPDENGALFEGALNNKPTAEMVEALKQFKGAYPYERFIAESSHVHDPFDFRVTEAYWIGNGLLERIPPDAFYRHLRERLEKKFPKEHIKRFFERPPYASFPHHALHVFNAFSGMGTIPDSVASGQGSDQELESFMDQCRISWGKVTGVEGQDLIVDYEPIVRTNGNLLLGPARRKKVTRQVQGRGFVDDASPGDWISVHWGFASSILTGHQVSSLRKYTLQAMQIANTFPIPQ